MTSRHSVTTSSRASVRVRLERDLRALTAIERGSASNGERASAEWIARRLEAEAITARVETAPAVGSYWLPLGLMASTGMLAAGLAVTARRVAAISLGLASTVALIDDLGPGRRVLRRALRRAIRRRLHNVVAELGDSDSKYVFVLVAHHDAAPSGWVFNPALSEAVARRIPGLIERTNTAPPIWAPVVAGPALVAVGAARDSAPTLGAGALLSAIAIAAFLDIRSSEIVPGGNDNASGVVALLEIARRLQADPPSGIRVVLVFTGAEEALWEGMAAFADRHFDELDAERTFFLNVDQVGDETLNVLAGEGPIWMRDYRQAAVDLVEQTAVDLDIPTKPGLRGRSGTDGLYLLKNRYTGAVLSSVNQFKAQSNYHWPTDTADNVRLPTLIQAVDLGEAVVRRFRHEWIGGRPFPAANPIGTR